MERCFCIISIKSRSYFINSVTVSLHSEAVNKRYELNGGVEGATDLFAALAAIIASFLKINWPVWGEITMGGLSLIATIVLFISSYSHIVYVAYACHVIYRSTFAFVITIARWVW